MKPKRDPHHEPRQIPGRFDGIRRHPTAEVARLRGTVQIQHSHAQLGARRVWHLPHDANDVAARGAPSGPRAVPADRLGGCISRGQASTLALEDSTQTEQSQTPRLHT
jgi:isocitrate lyase